MFVHNFHAFSFGLSRLCEYGVFAIVATKVDIATRRVFDRQTTIERTGISVSEAPRLVLVRSRIYGVELMGRGVYFARKCGRTIEAVFGLQQNYQNHEIINPLD